MSTDHKDIEAFDAFTFQQNYLGMICTLPSNKTIYIFHMIYRILCLLLEVMTRDMDWFRISFSFENFRNHRLVIKPQKRCVGNRDCYGHDYD